MNDEEIVSNFTDALCEQLYERAYNEEIGVFVFCLKGSEVSLSGNMGIESLPELGDLMTAITAMRAVMEEADCTPYLNASLGLIRTAIELHVMKAKGELH
jgi:hypothetical protein